MALNPRDQKKWDALQSAGDGSVDKILAGNASDADIKALSKLLAEQHQLAGEVFDQAVTDAQSTADSYIDTLNKRRIDSGKKPLTQKAHERLFQNSFKQVMAESLEDILAMVHQEFENHSDKVRDKVGEALEKLQKTVKIEKKEQAGPQQGPSLFERFAGYVGSRDGHDPRAPAPRSMLDRVLGRGRDPNAPQSSMLQSIKESIAGAKDKVTSLYDKLRGRNRDESEEKAANTWIRKLRSVFDPVGNAYKKMKAGGSKLKNILSMIGKPLLLALMNPQLIKSITGAIGEYLSFDNISKWVSGMWDDTKKFASDAFDTAMDKVKSFFGGSKDKDKAKAQPMVRSQAIPSSVTPAQAAKALPDLEAKIQGAKQKLDTAQSAYASNPSQANKQAVTDAQTRLQQLNVQYTQYANQARQPQTVADPVTKAQASVSTAPSPAVSGTDVQGPTTAVVPPAASATPVPKAAPMPTTEIVDGMPVYRSGRPVDMKPKAEKAAVTEGRKDAALSTIGLGSFGFDSHDPSLNILNMGMLS